MLKRFLILLLILSIILLNACAKPDPASDDTQPSTTSPTQETEPSATEPSPETEPSATNPSLPDIVDPYLRDYHLFGGMNELLSFYADHEDSMMNSDRINTLIHPDILTHPPYQVSGTSYTRTSAELIEFSGSEEICVFYHYCIGEGCKHHEEDNHARQRGEIKLLIWYNPDEYAVHPQNINRYGQLFDESLRVYAKESGDMTMYTCCHTPEYLFQFRVDRDIEGFDTIVEDVMQYFAEIAPQ